MFFRLSYGSKTISCFNEIKANWKPKDTTGLKPVTFHTIQSRKRLSNQLSHGLDWFKSWLRIFLKDRDSPIFLFLNIERYILLGNLIAACTIFKHPKKDLAITLTVQSRRPETNQRGPAFHCFTAGLPKTEFGLPLPN